MKLIVAVDKNWGIGKSNGLLFNLPEDMQFFKKVTTDKVVCMGYNTLLSFPGAKPLKNRVNIVLAPDGVVRNDCIVVHSLDELFKLLENYNTDDVFVIGGGMFYHTMYPYCNEAYITKVEADGGATVFFENLDKLPNWSFCDIGESIISNGLKITFTLYKNSTPKNYF